MVYRLEEKSTGDKILSATGPSPILSMIGESDSNTVAGWIVVEYDKFTSVIPNKSWDAKTFYNQTCVE